MYVDHHTASWLFDSPLASRIDAFMLHLFACRYAANTIFYRYQPNDDALFQFLQTI